MIILPIILFLLVIFFLLFGYSVAFTLSGVSIIFAIICSFFGLFDLSILYAIPNRIYGIMTNESLIAVPLFIFMGIMLEKSKIAEDLLETMSILFSAVKGGLGISIIFVGALLAASTGIVGATVVTMGILSLPTMLKNNYDVKVATGTILASGTLGQIIPPSIVLILLGDVMSSAYQEAQNNMGIFAQETVSVGDLFVGAIIPGLILIMLYMIYIIFLAYFKPKLVPTKKIEKNLNWYKVLSQFLAPISLILGVLGSIIFGIATPTEAAGLGAVGATILALVKNKISIETGFNVAKETMTITSMIFILLIGATIFSLVFRGLDGDAFIRDALLSLPGEIYFKIFIVMLFIFLLGFILDFIEITYVIVPVIAPALLMLDINPIWLAIIIAINLQTSFLTPPFGFAIFYLRGVIPKTVMTRDIYLGVIPFIIIQLIAISLVVMFPELATWMPDNFF